MFHHILVPLDGSPRAEQALPVAARLAHASGGTLMLLQIVTLPTMLAPYPAVDPATIQTIIDTDVEEAKRYVQRVTRLSSLKDIHVETEAIIAGCWAASRRKLPIMRPFPCSCCVKAGPYWLARLPMQRVLCVPLCPWMGP